MTALGAEWKALTDADKVRFQQLNEAYQVLSDDQKRDTSVS